MLPIKYLILFCYWKLIKIHWHLFGVTFIYLFIYILHLWKIIKMANSFGVNFYLLNLLFSLILHFWKCIKTTNSFCVNLFIILFYVLFSFILFYSHFVLTFIYLIFFLHFGKYFHFSFVIIKYNFMLIFYYFAFCTLKIYKNDKSTLYFNMHF